MVQESTGKDCVPFIFQASPWLIPIYHWKWSQSCAVSLLSVFLREQSSKDWVMLRLWSWGKCKMCCVLSFYFWAKYEKWWEAPKDQLPLGLQNSSLFSATPSTGPTHQHLWNGIHWLSETSPPKYAYLVLYFKEKNYLPKLKSYTVQFVKCFHKVWCHLPSKGVVEQIHSPFQMRK